MSSLSDRLQRLGPHLHADKTASTTSSKISSAALPARYHQLAAAICGELFSTDAGTYCRTIIPHSMPYADSNRDTALASLLPSDAHFLSGEMWSDPAIGDMPLDQVAFIDTETTGLGGAGAVPFVIGIGFFQADEFRVECYLLPEYADEAAMLEAVHQRLSVFAALVTYNGASFDLPLLRDRFIVQRIDRDYRPARHLDLLHLSRRVYRRRLGDCSLGNLEREVLGFERIDDIPGYLIPAAYFGWLQTDNPVQLASVVRHNADDIISLAALTGVLQNAVLSGGESLDRAPDMYGLARLFHRRRQMKQAGATLTMIHERQPAADVSISMTLDLAGLLKRRGELAEALRHWTILAEQVDVLALEARRQLAIHAEHRHRDYQAALEHVRAAEGLINDLSRREIAVPPRLVTGWAIRRQRLERWLERR